MMQHQKSRYAPGTWQDEVEKKLRVSEDGATVVAHLAHDQALLFLVHFLRREHRRLCLEWCDVMLAGIVSSSLSYLVVWGINFLFGKVTLPPFSVGLVISPLAIWILGRERRYAGWRNGLQAALFQLRRATLAERLPFLIEISGWLYARPRLSTPQMRQQFATLLTESLARADTSLLESLEPGDIARLVALVVRYPKGELPDSLLIAAVLALSHLRPESIPLRQKLHRLTYHSSPLVREAVEEFYRVPK